MMGEGEHPFRPDLIRDLRGSSRDDASFYDLQCLLEVAPANQEGVEIPKKPDLTVSVAERSSELTPTGQRVANIIAVPSREHG